MRVLGASAFSDWLSAYGAAWAEKDVDAMTALFTLGGRFQPDPHAPPIRGRDDIATHWRGEFDKQINPAFAADVWFAYEATGLAHWRAELVRVPEYDTLRLDGAMRALFDLEGGAPLCKRLELWPVQTVASEF